MRPALSRRAEPDPAAIRLTIESFLAQCKRPTLVQPGEHSHSLKPGSVVLTMGPRGVVLEAWGVGLNVVRRVTAARSVGSARLELRTVRFGGRDGIIYLQDESATHTASTSPGRRGLVWFERLAQREFPGAHVVSLTRSRDLERSLSGLHYRGRLREGELEWALVGSPPEATQQHCDDALVTGLIWLSELRKRGARHVAGLRVLLPRGKSATTAERMARLEPRLGAYELFEYHPRGGLTAVDLQDRGNIDVRLPCLAGAQDVPGRTMEWLAELERTGAEVVMRSDGARSVRINGIEFAKAGSFGLTYGLHTLRTAEPQDFPDVLRLARTLTGYRQACPPDALSLLYTTAPEAWLESQVRRRPQALDPGLALTPIYSQTPALAGLERGLIDLLAVGRDGRLAVIELKASESLRLPLQALDYWLRVEACRRQGMLEQRGYFADHTVADVPARVLLVAPALHFHPATDTLLAYRPRQMEVERIGLGSGWRRGLAVVFRKRETAARA